MKDEALKLALEVLQWSKPHKDAVITHSEAMTAIKAALAAQPAHVISEKEQLKQWIATTNYYRAKREYEPDAAQPAQEPWCMKMNRCTTKCEDCPDEPVQEKT
jgi:hypothetical protein